jgi:cbb3-type cytochrome oxidase subunit 3
LSSQSNQSKVLTILFAVLLIMILVAVWFYLHRRRFSADYKAVDLIDKAESTRSRDVDFN